MATPIYEFPPRVGFVRQDKATGEYVLTRAAYIYLRDAITPKSGVYTPTLYNVTNVAASTPYSCQFMRVGNTVHVSGRVDVDPTASGTQTDLGISIPFTSDFAEMHQCAGTGVAPLVDGLSGAIYADATNNRATLSFVTTITANTAIFFTFMYRDI